MLFQSFEYLLLLIFAIISIRFIPNLFLKKCIILILSLFFYAFGSHWQTFLFLFVIIFTYILAFFIDKYRNKILLFFSLFLVFTPLLLYKYIPFLLKSLCNVDIYDTFILPIGISFYTFQAVGYLIDVYYQKTKVVRNFLTYACFISFFPQLIAGPIERATSLVAQIETLKKPTDDDYSVGFRHILLGLCLKLLIAETVASFVDPVYNNINHQTGLSILIATLLFGIQIYCDFNGYTLIAIGSARLLGIKLITNFNHPYNAISITDFWRRWHISLSTWFKDYVYIPLGGNRKSRLRSSFNIITTFTISGIWHGANWTFFIWGFVNGLVIALEKVFIIKRLTNKVFCGIYAIITFILINLFWLFFRANNVLDAFTAIKAIFSSTTSTILSISNFHEAYSFFISSGWSRYKVISLLVALTIYVWYEYGKHIRVGLFDLMNSKRTFIRWTMYILITIVTLYFGSIIEQSDFVYFRF